MRDQTFFDSLKFAGLTGSGSGEATKKRYIYVGTDDKVYQGTDGTVYVSKKKGAANGN